MSDPEEEGNELLELLQHGHLTPAVVLTEFERFSDEAKDEVVARVARQFDPPPGGQLLAALQLIATEANKPEIIATYLANLRSPDPEGRRTSLMGLAELGYPQARDLALVSLRDDADQVVAAAADLLLPAAAADPRLRSILEGVYAAHRDDPGFHLTTSFLQAHGIGG